MSAEPISDVYRLIKRAVEKLETTFTLWTLAAPGPLEKVSEEEILRAADIVAAGYIEVLELIQGGIRYEYIEHRYYTSIKQAVLKSEYLANLLERYDVSIAYLLRKIKEKRSDLQYHTLYMRQPLPEQTIKQCNMYSEQMLNNIDPAVGRSDYLLDIHWMDECTIHVGKDLIQNKLHVWSYRQDTDGAAPEPNPKSKSLK